MARIHRALAALLLTGALGAGIHAQPAASAPAAAASSVFDFHIRPVDDTWRHALPRDPDVATQAYLERLSPAAVARSNAYFEGGYWLQLWNYLLGLGICWLLLRRGRAARVRDWAARVGRGPLRRDAIVGVALATAASVLSFPLTVYQDFVREHAYGMATQTFAPWLGEQLVALGVQALLAAIVVPLLYAIFRRAGARWWLWGSVAGIGISAVLLVLGPVLIEPLFNTYKPITDPTVRDAVLALARADGVPVDQVFEFDASRQTTRVSANVAGLLGSAAVRLNDNLLRTSLPEIRAVTGHELGHFVMHHIWENLFQLSVLLLAAFGLTQWAMGRLLLRHGAAWGLSGIADVATLPLLFAVLTTLALLATPLLNTLTRTQEIEADRFGLNLAREPHGAAEVFLKLTEYRKPDPGPVEEFVFYDHPSTRFRIHDAMRWRQSMGTP